MITLLYGSFGSGKTSYILNEIKKDTESKKKVFLIVPDQETVQYERATLNALPNSAQLYLELMGFSRLYNRVCRQYGGLSYRYATDAVRNLLMWRAMRECEPQLREYKNFFAKDLSICEVMLSTVDECKASGKTAEQLRAAGAALGEDDALGKKLTDLALIYSTYDRLLSKNYSDSSDDISRLYDKLREHRFFEGYNVYIDSFTSFTAAEHRVIEKIFESADNVTVSIPMLDGSQNDIASASLSRSAHALKLSAKKQGGYREISLGANRRAKAAALSHVVNNLWKFDVKATLPNDGSIIAEKCDTAYAEAEAVSNHILSLLRRGERCRDMLVLARSPENYRGILEPAFSKNGIPFYFSEKSDLNSLPPVKLLYSALRIYKYGWQKNDVITHIKTGLYPFALRDADLFEEYLETWNINGSRFTQEEPWSMNPDGYTKNISDRGKEILAAANRVRGALISHLEKFFIPLKAAKTVDQKCRAVYSYFTDIQLEDKLLELADKEEKMGNSEEAAKYRAVYGVILNALADIAAALPDEAVDDEEFYTVLRAVFDKTQVGTIPTSIDQVMIGSAATVRASNPKYTFVLGLCEGEFPTAVNEGGIFTSADRERLAAMNEDIKIELSSDADIRSSDELMYVAKAFSTPSHGLYLFTAAAEFGGNTKMPSMPFRRVISLLELSEEEQKEAYLRLKEEGKEGEKIDISYKPHIYSGDDLRYLVGAPRSAIAHVRALSGSPEGEALRSAISKYLPRAEELSLRSVSAPENLQISKEAVQLAHGDTALFSATSFERYVNCPMSYYCSGVLRLRERVNDDFIYSDMGTFVHAILQEVIKYATTRNENGEIPSDDEIMIHTEKVVLDYIDQVSPSEFKNSKRLRHIYQRLADIARLMIRNIVEEFSASDFYPAFFELSIGEKDSHLPCLTFEIDDGSKVAFRGKIDRVDLFKNEDGLFVRIVDYKTGSKVFSLDDVNKGINTQMLLYLFMLCKSDPKSFCRLVGENENTKAFPAGIIYLSADIHPVDLTKDADEEAVLKKATSDLKRSGLLLNNPEILSAMNRNFSSRFLAGISKAASQEDEGKEILVGDALTTDKEFDNIYEEVSNTIRTLLKKLREGDAGAHPLRYGENDPCQYCKMKAVCRREDV